MEKIVVRVENVMGELMDTAMVATQIRPEWKDQIVELIEENYRDDEFFPEVEDLYNQFVSDQIHYTVFMSKCHKLKGTKTGGRRVIWYNKFLQTIKNNYGHLNNLRRRKQRAMKNK